MRLIRPTETQAAALADRRAAIRANLALLPNDRQRVIVLLHAMGWKVREIAAFEFGIGYKRVGQIITKARQRMEAARE